MHVLPYLPYYTTALMALMHGHVSDVHGIKTRNK